MEVRPHEKPGAHSGWWLGLALALALALTRLHGHLLFHTTIEVFTVVVSASVFFLAWNARRFLDNHYLLLVGIAFLFVGIIDLLHALAYKGMGVFPGQDGNLATQFWIAGRYVQSASLLAATLFVRRKLRVWPALCIYCAAAGLLVVSVFAGRFPACFVEGAGLTPFKVASEYLVCAVLLAAGVLLLRSRASFDPSVLRQLGASILLTMAAELSFTLYTDVYGLANVAGHLLRFVAVCFIYRAIIVTGLVRPYDVLFRNLTLSEEALRRSDERYRAFVARTSEGIFRIEIEQPIPASLPEDEQVRRLLQQAYVAECNDAYARTHGAARATDVIGTRPDDPVLARDFVRSGYRMPETEAAAGERWIEASLTGVVEEGCLVRAWGVQRDVTERRSAGLERERLIAELQQALAEVKTLTGLLPICANCKKIRDDRGYWTQVESYIGQRTRVAFSHGICPGCMKSLYPEYYADTAPAERG